MCIVPGVQLHPNIQVHLECINNNHIFPICLRAHKTLRHSPRSWNQPTWLNNVMPSSYRILQLKIELYVSPFFLNDIFALQFSWYNIHRIWCGPHYPSSTHIHHLVANGGMLRRQHVALVDTREVTKGISLIMTCPV
jgi:hypothetical protein